MLRTCVHCGVECETKSARSRFYCDAPKCRAASRRVKGRTPRNKAREALYWKRVKKGVREGKGPGAYFD